jgi:hypothetical protein
MPHDRPDRELTSGAASWSAVDIRTTMRSGSAAGVVRLILLALAATGFLAMHGIAATDPVAGHVSPLDAHSVVAPVGPSEGMHDSEPAASTMGPEPACDGSCHDDMAACAFILLTVLAGAVLHALGIGAGRTWPNISNVRWSRRGPARAPPQPIFLSLCVFRL